MRKIFPFLLALSLRSGDALAQVNVWTYHNDSARTGANTNETILTPGDVNTNSFGKLFSYAVDGYVYAQPLYVANVATTNKGVHNVVFVVSEHDSAYAFDADSNSGSNSAPLWQRSFVNPGSGITTVGTNDVGTTDILPEIGITGTPVIDVTSGTMYLVAKTKQISGGTTNFVQALHALDITSGNDRPNSPVTIQASVPGTGEGNDGHGNVPFSALRQNQRSALLLLNGVVYIGWASHGDNSPYHGWVMAYDAGTLQQVSVFNANPNGVKCGIWMAGGGLAADASNNIFCVTGNGTFDGATNNDYGDSVLKLSVSATTNLSLADYFTPYNQLHLSTNDTDFGSGGIMVLPDSVGSVAHPHLVVCAGKEGKVCLVDRENLGHYNPAGDSQIVQFITNAIGVCLSSPAYFNGGVYYMAYKDSLKRFAITNGQLSTNPITKSVLVSGIYGASPTISANGTNNAIAWILLTDAFKTNGPAVLHAYDANNLGNELYNSAQAGTRDVPGGAVKLTLPTAANGKVYVGTETSLAVYGNGAFTSAPIITSQPRTQTVTNGSQVSLSVGVLSNGTFTSQWLFDGAAVPGATTTNYSIPGVQITNAGNYSVILSNASGTTLSSLAYLSVISQLTNAPGSILAPTGLVNWWPADGNAVDIFSGNNGTPEGAFAYTSGESGLAFKFDGTTTVLTVGAPAIPPPWTASLWVNRQNAPGTSACLLGDASYALKIEQYNGTHKVGFTHFGVADYPFNYTAPTGTWVHLVFVGLTNQTQLYVNGALQDSTNVSISLPRAYIGATLVTTSFVDYMLGGVDEIALFSRALSSTEISALYAAGSAGMIRSPQFTGVGPSGNGQFTLNLRGQTGKTLTIYSSSNLINWSALGTISNPTGATQFIDSVTSGSQKFYRASQP
jgi:hypothetical protein